MATKRKPLLSSDFSKGEYSYEAKTSMWSEEKTMLFVDLPDGDELNQWIDKINKKLLWLDENRETITQAVTDSKVFSDLHIWTTEAVTAEDFRAGLFISEIGFSFQWKQAQVYIGCERDYFGDHIICLYLDEQNKVTGCGLEG